ncbi:MAG: DUF2817 domain-containing protein [Burkholderiaceae bacterium]|nr:DUF2817 domain-containing protein [Burkholderiaceae bacterium]
MSEAARRLPRPVEDPFSSSYREAQRKFLEAAGTAGAALSSCPHPMPGREGEPLAIDVALQAPPGAGVATPPRGLLLLTSGCHGVEGFAGSGVQVAALQDEALRDRAASKGVALLHVHALNPYGFSHFDRATEDNVDLNRNFRDFSQPLPVNDGYRALHPLLVPARWPPDEENAAALMQAVVAHGPRAFQAIVTGGQHEFRDGLFYGGTRPCWSNRALRDILRGHAAGARRIGWIDLHTGLGPAGVGERILACAGPAAVERARRWWGDRVTSIEDDTAVSSAVSGPMWTAVTEECPDAEYTGIALEFGTLAPLQVLHALRGQAWLRANPAAPTELAERIRRETFEAFFVESDEWRDSVLRQAREAIAQAIDGLADGGAP